jgi:sigma-54 dependent transcriptional regulator, acetoin dehydrogenase operon transcriptional activator AcoR
VNQQMSRAILNSEWYNGSVKTAWSRYLRNEEILQTDLRSEIAHSWETSKDLGVNPFQSRINEVINDQTLAIRLKHNKQLLSYASPRIQQLLDLFDDSKTVLSIADKDGTILKSVGEKNVLKRAEKRYIFAGGTWTEKSAGTNAVGLVLRTKQSSQVLFSEHFCENVHDWYCVAFPILTPFTKELLGIVNLAGNASDVHRHSIGYALAEAKNMALSLERHFFEYALQHQLFLHTALEKMDHIVLSVDLSDQILTRNEIANRSERFQNETSIASFPELKALVDNVRTNGQQIVNEQIRDGSTNKRYQVSIYPVRFQDHLYGVVIFLQQDHRVVNKKKPSPIKAPTRYRFSNMVGVSPTFQALLKQAEKAACLRATIFISGETGTGKEVLAQAIHQASDRGGKPFVAINCGAVPPSLLESELSGYEAGAFTGSKAKGSAGKFEQANGGTIFLDEIGDMPLDLQVHLLRILEERVVTRIGGSVPIPVDVRVISATNKDLKEAVQKGTFREDLYYRLCVLQMELPPLRERIEDIPVLIQSFLPVLCQEFGKQSISLTRETLSILENYHWPGNIRELKNVLQQAMFMMDSDVIHPHHLPDSIYSQTQGDEHEKQKLLRALEQQEGNVTKAAASLNMSRATIYRKLKKYRLERH